MELKEQELKCIAELLNITTKMLSAFNLPKLLRQILDTSLELLRADSGSLMLLEAGSQTLKIKAAKGLPKDLADKVNVKLGEHISGWVAKNKEPILLIGGLKNDPRFANLDEKKEIKSSICVPLKVEERVIGVLNVNNVNSEYLFCDSDLKLLSLLANQAAISIWNVTLYEEAKKANEEKMLMQDELIEREKMAALGQFSIGIAHEINNPLATIMGNSQYLMEHMRDSSFGWEEIKDIKDAAELCSRIIVRLFKYSSPKEHKKEEILDTNEALRQTVGLVESQFTRQNIKINLNLRSYLKNVRINPDELKEVFLNIIFNAKSVMPKGGALNIETNDIESDRSVEIIFSDTGPGIAQKFIDKIFEPFFTTGKPQSLGLGLSICRRIINSHGGKLWAKSEPGKGASFIIRLPYADAKT